MNVIYNKCEQDAPDSYYLAAALAISGGLQRGLMVQAIGRLGSAKAVYEAEESILEQLGFRSQHVMKHLVQRQSGFPLCLWLQCQRLGVRLLTIFEDDYPASLRQIADPPLVLYVMGQLPQAKYAVAIVGSRDCTDYGLKAAKFFSKQLALRGIPIISGGARGIDTAAHEACLEAGGTTVAVLGCGIDVAYPEENKALFQRIAQNGAVITEYAPGVSPLSRNFPARNRIVVGLSQAVLVAEAAQKSGALITAHLAADEGREVYCVPGSIFTGKSVGCHSLLRKGAKPVDCVEDILEDKADWQFKQRRTANQGSIFDYQVSEAEARAYEQQKEAARKKRKAEQAAKLKQAEAIKLQRLEGLGAEAVKIYNCFTNEVLGFDALIELSGESFMTVSRAVLDLQVAGLIQDEGLQQYRRI